MKTDGLAREKVWDLPGSEGDDRQGDQGLGLTNNHGESAFNDGVCHSSRSQNDQRPANPLDGVFSGKAPTTKTTSKAWTGPASLNWRDLFEPLMNGDDGFEAQLLKASGGQAVLIPYCNFDATKKPVILVHGLDAGPESMIGLARELSVSHQVLILAYDDRAELTGRNGAQLAKAIQELRQTYYGPSTELAIVGHSMGGVVARAGLNYLQQPDWQDGNLQASPAPRGGFARVRLVTVDTPWDGGSSFYTELPGWRMMAYLLARAAGWEGAWEMRCNSRLYRNLYGPELGGVEFVNHAAAERMDAGLITSSLRSLPDLSTKELAAIARYVIGGAEPPTHRACNLARALADDVRFSQLAETLSGRLGPNFDNSEMAAALIEAYEETMPRYAGNHMSIVTPGGHPVEIIDRIVRDIGN